MAAIQPPWPSNRDRDVIDRDADGDPDGRDGCKAGVPDQEPQTEFDLTRDVCLHTICS
jgi:hypothetical protein